MVIKSLAQTLKDLATGIKNTITGITSSNATLTIIKGNGTTSTVTVNNVANAGAATKATQDSAGQQINSTYIKGLSVSGQTITYTKGNNTTGTITTQDTTYAHPNSGVTAGTYKSVTVNAQGHVTAGSNPTTLAGYGITDASLKGHTHDDRYYTESEIDSKVNTINASLNNKSDTTHTHSQYLTASSDLNVNKLKGVISLDNLPAGALERLVKVTNDTARFALTTNDIQLGDTVKVESTKMMYIVKNITKLNSEDGYEQYTAGMASSVPWSGVTGKPSSYTPSAHTHDDRYYTESEIDSKLAGKQGSLTATGSATKGMYIDSSGTAKAMTYSVNKDVPSDAKFTDTVYTHPTTAGNKHIPSGGSSGQILRWSADGTAVWGADNNTTYSPATQSANGLMSAADKKKLDGIATGANAYTHPNSGVTAGTYRSVTVNAQGHVTGGSNPTTLSGYGITDAPTKTGSGASGTWGINISGKANTAGTADTATKATQDSAGQQINTTYIKGLSISGRNITYTKGNGTTGTITTQDTTYNFGGTTFYSGNQNTAEHDANNCVKNGHYYYTSNGPSTSIGATTTDGGLYTQSYDDSWLGQIAQDYRNGRLFVRGRTYGTWTSWLALLDSSNYNNYAPTKTGGGASGTWGINISGNAASATNADKVDGIHAASLFYDKGAWDADNWATTGIYEVKENRPTTVGYNYGQVISSSSGGSRFQLYVAHLYNYDGRLHYRTGWDGDKQPWNTILDSENYNLFTPTKTGSGASGTWGISISGKANTAGTADISKKVYGSYSYNGGQQGPAYFGRNSAGFLMSNANVNSDTSFKNWLYMDNYDSDDVGGATAFGVSRVEPRAFLMQSDAKRSSWNNYAELLSTYNYNTYAPKKDGTGASGTWGINITGNAANATTANTAKIISGFAHIDDGTWGHSTGTYITGFREIGGGSIQWRAKDGQLYERIDGTFWQREGTYEVIDTSTVNNYAPTKTGGGASGTWGINISGNSATATKATQDSAGQQINTTYIKGLSVSGKTITYTKGNGSTGTITTQDTVYTLPAASSSALGGIKMSYGTDDLSAGSSSLATGALYFVYE